MACLIGCGTGWSISITAPTARLYGADIAPRSSCLAGEEATSPRVDSVARSMMYRRMLGSLMRTNAVLRATPSGVSRNCETSTSTGSWALGIAYYNRGKGYLSKGEFDSAIVDNTKAIEIDPLYAAAYTNRGTAYGGKGEYGRQIADYSKAIEVNPKYAWAYEARAWGLLQGW
jgi:Tetratricopeptide repeat